MHPSLTKCIHPSLTKCMHPSVTKCIHPSLTKLYASHVSPSAFNEPTEGARQVRAELLANSSDLLPSKLWGVLVMSTTNHSHSLKFPSTVGVVIYMHA